MTIDSPVSPQWLALVDKWTQGDKQKAELLQMWFGSLLVEGLELPDDLYRQLRDFLSELDERDPTALGIIFRTIDMLKGYVKSPEVQDRIAEVYRRKQ